MFWGEPDATITFCEAKYASSPYVSEWWNTVSNIGYIVVAGLTLGICPTTLKWPAFCVGFIGLGSTLFHATGLFTAQVLDEMAMLLWTLCFFSSLLRAVPEVSKASRQSIHDILWASNVMAMTVYFSYRQFALFFACFVVDVLLVVWLALRVTRRAKRARGAVKLAVGLMLAASVCWFLERWACPYTHHAAWGHVLWHLLTAAACFIAHKALFIVLRTRAHANARILYT